MSNGQMMNRQATSGMLGLRLESNSLSCPFES
jgi:hypothetical protein